MVLLSGGLLRQLERNGLSDRRLTTHRGQRISNDSATKLFAIEQKQFSLANFLDLHQW